MPFYGPIVVLLSSLLLFMPAPAAAEQDCSRSSGVMDLKDLDRFAQSAMHGHVLYVTCIASALVIGNYENASYIATTKLGLNTKGGFLSKKFGYNEPSQDIWERGYDFRLQATRFAASAKATASVKSEANRFRTHREFVELLTHCQGCHETMY